MLCGKHSFFVRNLLRHRSGLFLAGKEKLKLRMLIMQALGCLRVSSFSGKQMSALCFWCAQWEQDTGGWISPVGLLEDWNYLWQGTLRLSVSLEELAVWNGLTYVCRTDLTDFAFCDINTPLTLVTPLTFFFFQASSTSKRHCSLLCSFSLLLLLYHICFIYWCWHWMLNLWCTYCIKTSSLVKVLEIELLMVDWNKTCS